MQINFIPDEVLTLTDKNDLLGTKPYSKTIFDIVDKCEGKKNIGLFGSWGSGKSTILTTFEDLISEHNNQKENINNRVAYFEFDAWKYSQDDFRRSFLIEFTKKFNISYEKKLHSLLYNESSFENPELSTHKFNKWSLPNWILLILIIFGLTFYYWPVLELNKDVKVIVSMLALVVSVLSTALKNTINKYKVVVKENKVVEPERFERVFDDIISEITHNPIKSSFISKWIKKLKNKPNFRKVVIVIDNLDRCDDENLLETLNTVKNFLEHKKVIFILPVDEKGISAFLSKKTDNADEYLRKIFHLIIRLKEFSKKELFEFTKKINELYNLGLDAPSLRIICSEFTSNPRKIIQFLNNYQSEMKLIEEQSAVGYVNQSYVKDNLSFFIKLLIVKYEWRSLYNEILYDKTLLNKINNVITHVEPDLNGLYQINRTNVKLTDSQRNFFFSTQEIHSSKIDPFILNIDLDKDIPDEISEFIKNGNYTDIVNYLNDIELNFTEHKLLQKINEVYSNLTYKHREYTFIATPILKLIINFTLDNKQEKFRKTIIKRNKEYTFLKSLFKNPQISVLFVKFDFERLTRTAKWFSDNISDDLLISYLDHFNKTLFKAGHSADDEKEKINSFLNIFKGTKHLNKIKSNFSAKLTSKPELAKIESLKDYSIASNVITQNTYKAIAKKLNDKKDTENLNKYYMFDICHNYILNNQDDNVTRKHLLNYHINEIQEFYQTESISKNVYGDYEDYFKTLYRLFKGKTNIELSSEFKSTLTALNEHLYNNLTSSFVDENYSLYEAFFKAMKNLMFYTKDFKNISDTEEFFCRYLDMDISKKINLCLTEILHQDVINYDVYDYPFADTLINYYEDTKRAGFAFGKTLITMLEKSNKGKGLNDKQKKKIILRTINKFSIVKNQNYITLMKKLKKVEGNLFLEVLNEDTGVYTGNYVESVKLLEDNWFYGNSIFNYLSYPIDVRGTYPNFLSRLREVSKIFTQDEQIEFIQDLIDDAGNKVYKWLRSSHKFLNKKVFDVYIANLQFAHKNSIVGHNDFFEWIISIPTSSVYKKRRNELVKYLNSLDITHKTYKPKKDKALKHLS